MSSLMKSFIACIVISVIVGIACFWHTSHRFNTACEKICSIHNDFMSKSCTFDSVVYMRDSVVIINGNMSQIGDIIDKHDQQIQALLQLQHQEVSEDFSTLTLWSSTLMIIFLVFSLYAMFKVEDIQRNAAKILEEVNNSAQKAREEISKIEESANRQSEQLKKDAKQSLKTLKDEEQQQIKQFNESMEELIKGYSQNINSQMEKFDEIAKKKASELNNTFLQLVKAIKSLPNESDPK